MVLSVCARIAPISCGGQLNDSGSHLLDIVLWITGMWPVQQQATIDNRGTPVDIDSTVAARFDGGAMATFVVVGSALGSATMMYGKYISTTATTALCSTAWAHRRWPATGAGTGGVEAAYGALMVARIPAFFIHLIQGRVTQAAAPASCGLAVARLTERPGKARSLACAVTLSYLP